MLENEPRNMIKYVANYLTRYTYSNGRAMFAFQIKIYKKKDLRKMYMPKIQTRLENCKLRRRCQEQRLDGKMKTTPVAFNNILLWATYYFD